MKRNILHLLMVLFLGFHSYNSLAQPNPTRKYLEEMKGHNFSHLLMGDSIYTYEDRENKTRIRKMGILGFAGPEFQRIKVRFVLVKKNPKNPLEYQLVLRLKQGDSIFSFKGNLKIQEAYLYRYCEIPLFEKGYIISEISLKETGANQTRTLSGRLVSRFMMDDRKNFTYGTIGFQSEKYCNNQFIGTWLGWPGDSSLTCNWGDYRIPDCGDLDIGENEFSVNPKYVNKGWENFYRASISYPDTPEYDEAWKKEYEKWWK